MLSSSSDGGGDGAAISNTVDVDTDLLNSQEKIEPAAQNTNEKISAPLPAPKRRQKLYHWTVCMVPPPPTTPTTSTPDEDRRHLHHDNPNQRVWDAVTQCRTQLRDPGLFRWPSHANLLYPFYHCYSTIPPPSVNENEEVTDANEKDNNEQDATRNDRSRVFDPEIMEGLVAACRQCEPFTVRLCDFGTFGGRNRGVLWLYPDSRASDSSSDNDEPLVRLQSLLVESFPACNDQNLKSSGNKPSFTPHMTVTHFASLDEAEVAREHWQAQWPDNGFEFVVDTIYVLTRQGDDGQFQRVADISLGSTSTAAAVVHDPPLPFGPMPTTEADWVREERMKMKERRKGGGGRRRRRGNHSTGRRRSASPRVPDTPEVIAAKRAERKAKREAAEAMARAAAGALDNNS